MSISEPEFACTSRQTISRWRDGHYTQVQDDLAVEVPVALEFNGVSHAVMLATPCELEAFALGFALSEDIIAKHEEFFSAEVEQTSDGITVHCEISSVAFLQLKQRRRNLTGRTGCGLCGVESLQQVMRTIHPVAQVSDISVLAMRAALQELATLQPLNQLTGGMHAAAWSDAQGKLVKVCEDVGRHNALDKLIGNLAMRDTNFQQGFLLITSRASVEMVQKAATLGIANLIAISAPTSLAVHTAQQLGMTLIAFARGENFVAYTHCEKIRGK